MNTKPCPVVLIVAWCAVSALPSSAQQTRPAPGATGRAQPIGAIVIPAQPEPTEVRAAHELAKFLSKMTGESYPVVGEDDPRPDGRALLVGRTRANLENHDPDGWPRDTIYLGYGDGDIAIIGQGPQGTLFAAYEFLRDRGARWYAPDNVWPDDAFIPKRDALDLPDVPRRHTPSFVERGWHPPPAAPGTWRAHYHDWAVRNGVNALKPGMQPEYGEERGHGVRMREGHTMYVLIPSGDHREAPATFAAHPEWYAQFNGERVTQYKDGRPVQACLSNPQVVQETARKVLEYLREHPDCTRFSVSPCDEPTYWCECEPCRAMDGPNSTWKKNDSLDAYGLRSKSGPGPMATRWVAYVNRVARIVGKEFPDTWISFYAYGTTVAPPRQKGWKLEPNVMIEYAFGDGVCLLHDAEDRACPPNAAFHRWLTEWATSGNPIVIYDYPLTGGRMDIPAGFIRRGADLIGYTTRAGLHGWAGENQGSWAAAGLWQYLKARLLWDAEADVDALIDEYCRDNYGPAAEAMKVFYTAVEVEAGKAPGHPVWGGWAIKIRPASFARLEGLLAEAEELADSDVSRRNVAMMRVAFNAWILAWMESPDNASRVRALKVDYDEVRRRTRELVEEHAVPVTDRWRDNLFANPYRAPIEAVSGKPLVELADGWRFRADPDDEGIDATWYSDTGAAADLHWRDIRVDDYWTEQGITYHGAAWYATTLAVPADAGDGLWLLFGMIDGDAQVWVDGEPVGELPGDPWDKPKAFEITRHVRPGESARVVIRVHKTAFAAGIKDGVKLVAARR